MQTSCTWQKIDIDAGVSKYDNMIFFLKKRTEDCNMHSPTTVYILWKLQHGFSSVSIKLTRRIKSHCSILKQYDHPVIPISKPIKISYLQLLVRQDKMGRGGEKPPCNEKYRCRKLELLLIDLLQPCSCLDLFKS